jgi:hypothetical protein
VQARGPRRGCRGRIDPWLTAGVCALLAVLAAGLVPGGVAAHTGKVQRVEQVTAGPYTLNVLFYSETRAGQDVQLLVAPIVPPGAPQPQLDLQVVAQPGPGTSADAVRGIAAPDEELAGAYGVRQPLPVAGAWTLEFAVSGPQGPGVGRLAVTAAAPGAIPVGAGWALALVPLLGLVLFGLWQWRWLRSRRSEGLKV